MADVESSVGVNNHEEMDISDGKSVVDVRKSNVNEDSSVVEDIKSNVNEDSSVFDDIKQVEGRVDDRGEGVTDDMRGHTNDDGRVAGDNSADVEHEVTTKTGDSIDDSDCAEKCKNIGTSVCGGDTVANDSHHNVQENNNNNDDINKSSKNNENKITNNNINISSNSGTENKNSNSGEWSGTDNADVVVAADANDASTGNENSICGGDVENLKSSHSVEAPTTFDESSDVEEVLLNPFTHRIQFRFPYDYIKVAVLTVVLLPIRVFGIFISLLIAYIVSTLGLYGLSREELTDKPLTGWRRKLRSGMNMSGRFMTHCYGFHVITFKGKKATKKEAPIMVVTPHSSFFDGSASYWTGGPGLVSRIENRQIPLFGKYIDFTQPVYVRRENPNSRQETIQQIRHRAISDEDWPQVMIFPEGTCTNRTCLITFKPGAFYPGVPIQPIVIRYPNKMDTTTWTWDGPGAVKLLWLTLCQFHNYCEMEFLPVYNPSQEEKEDAHLYANNVRAVMAKALGVPVVDYSYDDCRLMQEARNNNLPPEIGLVEFQNLRLRYGVKVKDVEEVLAQQFSPMAESNGRVRLQGLARYLHLPPTEATVLQLFSLYDTKKRGEITFREYIVGYLEMVKPAVTAASVLRAFKFLNNANHDTDDNIRNSTSNNNTDNNIRIRTSNNATNIISSDGATDKTSSGDDKDDKAEGSSASLSLEKLTETMTGVFGCTTEQSGDMFRGMDANNKGYVTLDEFRSLMDRNGSLVWVLAACQASIEDTTREPCHAVVAPAPVQQTSNTKTKTE